MLVLWCVELVFDFGVESLWDADGWAKALAGVGVGGCVGLRRKGGLEPGSCAWGNYFSQYLEEH